MPRAMIGPIALGEQLRRVVEVAVDTGMVTTATLNTLTDATKNWPDNQWKDYVVEIVSGTGEGQIRKIVSNTSNTLVVDPPWTTVPNPTSRYAIRFVGVGVMSLSAWGGVALTGRDVTQDLQKLQNLDTLLSSRASEATLASIDGKVATEATLGAIKSKTDNLDVLLSSRAPKDEGDTITICTNQDISAGVTAALKNFKRWTLYLKVAGAIDIKIELSPNNQTTWFTIPESPVSFAAAGDNVLEFGYDCTHIRLTGSNTNAVTAIVRGVF